MFAKTQHSFGSISRMCKFWRTFT